MNQLLTKITFHLVNVLLRQIHTNNFIDLNQVQAIVQSYLFRVKELFNPNNIRKIRNNLNKEEKLAFKEMKSWDDKVIRVQDKGSRFVVLDTNSYIEKVEHQINRSSFDKLDADPSPKFKEKVNNWLEKWSHIITNIWK